MRQASSPIPRADLVAALIGIEPLPSVTAHGVEFFRHPNGTWTWRSGQRPGLAHDGYAPAGSTIAKVLAAILAGDVTASTDAFFGSEGN